MKPKFSLEQILFIDIETVPKFSSYEELSEREKLLWNKKSALIKKEDTEEPSNIYNKAGIYAEFGKIICIGIGFFYEEKFRVKAISGHNEKLILDEFINITLNFEKRNKTIAYCAHNGDEFDFPYISRRMLLNGIKIPNSLDSMNKKKWEIPNFIDTMEMWRFGDYKNFTSLDLLTCIFDIPTPKDEIDGSMIADYYWNRDDLSSIAKYCKKDVIAVAKIYQKLLGMTLVDDKNIEIID